MTLNTFAVKVSNQMVFKDTVKQIRYLLKRDFMVSKIIRNNGERQDEVVNGQTVIEEGDILADCGSSYRRRTYHRPARREG